MPRAATAAARTAPAPRGRAAAPARRPRSAPARRPARTTRSAAPRKAIRVVPRGGTRPAAAAIGSGLLDRLLRGRVWIACIAALLAGVVALNVSLLEINRGITAKAERAAELERGNAELRLRVAELASSERIQEAAAARGFVLPAPGEVHYVEPERGDAKRAAEGVTAPTDTPAPPPQPQTAAPEAAPPAAVPGQQPLATEQQEAPAPEQQAEAPAETAPEAATPPAPAGGAGTGAEQAPATPGVE